MVSHHSRSVGGFTVAVFTAYGFTALVTPQGRSSQRAASQRWWLHRGGLHSVQGQASQRLSSEHMGSDIFTPPSSRSWPYLWDLSSYGTILIPTSTKYILCKSSVCPRGDNPVLGIVADPEEDVPGTGLTAETQHLMLYSNTFLDS